jgi:cobyrinic acid a,c-diamide synthase
LARGVVIAAPRSGSGKTLVTLGMLAALKASGVTVAPAKTGPDYIDPAFLARAAGSPAVNLDPFAMSPARLRTLAGKGAEGADLLVVEGVMGLFDGAADGTGSTADLAVTLGLPVVLVVDATRQSHSVAALVSGFVRWREDVRVVGVILNKVASPRHETMLRHALDRAGVECLGAVPADIGFDIPDRHLGLVLPGEVEGFDAFLARAAEVMQTRLDLDAIMAICAPLANTRDAGRLPPLGQRIAIARDAAFAFVYEHMLADWRAAGSNLTFFSPLADEGPGADADAVFLPGGYPELHGAELAVARNFKSGLAAARDRRALIYGECGGFMVLGRTLTDREGATHQMAGLLPLDSHIDRPRRVLGYRRLVHQSPLPWANRLMGHEFHYSSAAPANLPPLFTAVDALGEARRPMGAVDGRVMGSYAHVIDVDETTR